MTAEGGRAKRVRESKRSKVIYVPEKELRDQIAGIIAEYPWFDDYPVECHRKCARWDIDREYGVEAGKKYAELGDARFLLGEDEGGLNHPPA